MRLAQFIGPSSSGRRLAPFIASIAVGLAALGTDASAQRAHLPTDNEAAPLAYKDARLDDGVITAPVRQALTASRTDARYFDVLKQNQHGQWKVWRHTWQTM